MIGVYDEADNVIETHEHAGELKGGVASSSTALIGQYFNCRQSVALALVPHSQPWLRHSERFESRTIDRRGYTKPVMALVVG